MLNHAAAWKHVAGMDSDTLQSAHAQTDAIVPLLAGLAGNPKVSRRDVIKATADAAGSHMIKAAEGIQFITSMPQDPEKLRPWLTDQYKTHMSALIHMKAALMQPGGAVTGGGMPPAAPAGGPAPAAPMTPPGVPPQ